MEYVLTPSSIANSFCYYTPTYQTKHVVRSRNVFPQLKKSVATGKPDMFKISDFLNWSAPACLGFSAAHNKNAYHDSFKYITLYINVVDKPRLKF